jgi:hypothetical protein
MSPEAYPSIALFNPSVDDGGSTVDTATSAAVGVSELTDGVSADADFVSVDELQAERMNNTNAIAEIFFMFEKF